MTNDYKSCEGCSARSHAVGFVLPEGDPASCDYVAIGQGPGQTEAERGIPFFPGAPAGYRFGAWINRAGKPRQDLLITNIVWCWLPKLSVEQRKKVPVNKWGNREPTMAEAKQCWKRHLGPLLKKLPEKVPFFTLGMAAMEWMLGTRDSRRIGTVNKFTVESLDERAG